MSAVAGYLPGYEIRVSVPGFVYQDLTFLEAAAAAEIENPAAFAAGFRRHTWNANGSRLQLPLFIIPGMRPFVKPSFLSAPAPRRGERAGAASELPSCRSKARFTGCPALSWRPSGFWPGLVFSRATMGKTRITGDWRPSARMRKRRRRRSATVCRPGPGKSGYATPSGRSCAPPASPGRLTGRRGRYCRGIACRRRRKRRGGACRQSRRDSKYPAQNRNTAAKRG